MPTKSKKRNRGTVRGEPARADGGAATRGRAIVPLSLMALAIVLVLCARVRLLTAPLERDEGEYAFIGQMMLDGVAPYAEAANMKLPGTNAAYAAIMAIFGQTIAGIHIGLLLVNAGTVVLLYFLARRLFDPVAAAAVAASYAVLSVSHSVLGVWAHATQFVVLPAIGGVLLLLQWAETRKTSRLICAGLLLGIGFLMKQPGIFFAAFGALYVIFVHRDDLRRNFAVVIRDLALLGAGAAAPFGITCLLLWRAGVFQRFWLWVFTYAGYYVSITSAAGAWSNFFDTAGSIVRDNLGLALAALAGIIILWREKAHRERAIVWTGLAILSAAAVSAGFYFRQHYYVLALPAAALAVGAVASEPMRARFGNAPLWLLAAALAYSLGYQFDYLFRQDALSVARATYGTSPFPEAIRVGEYLREHTRPEERIEVLGSEPEIYFYAHRKAVTPYVYVFPLMEPQPLAPAMQAEYIRDVETRRPEYVVLVNCKSSWNRRENSDTRILDWAVPYLGQHYDEAGVVDILPGGAIYQWGPQAATYVRKSDEFLIVLQRKP